MVFISPFRFVLHVTQIGKTSIEPTRSLLHVQVTFVYHFHVTFFYDVHKLFFNHLKQQKIKSFALS